MSEKKNPLKKMKQNKNEEEEELEQMEVDPSIVVAVLSAKYLELDKRVKVLEEELNEYKKQN